jgi:hypothetical protein
VQLPLLQAFPFPSTLGEVTLHPLSQACVFIYSSRGKWAFPPSCGVFLLLPLLQASQILVAGLRHLSCLLWWLVYLQFCWGCPSPLFGAQDTPLLCYISFFFVVAYYSVLFSFFPGWGVSLSPGAMLIWPRVVCGSTACRLAHLVVCFFPSGLVAREPSSFLCLPWSGDAMHGLGVSRSQSFASSRLFFHCLP